MPAVGHPLSTGRSPAPDTGWLRAVPSSDLGQRVTPVRIDRDGTRQIVLVWRTRRGHAVALAAECPHRSYVMSDARLVDDSVECPVHLYRYAADGSCVNVRHGRPARVVDVRESDGWIWLAI